MKNQTWLVGALTAVNVVVFAVTLAVQARTATSDAVSDVVRARALQIVDAQGRVRASITVMPEDPTMKWKGKPYPETVLFRLITADGRPNVKISATRAGSGLMIAGEDDPTVVQVLAEEGEPTVRIVNQSGAERIIKP